MPSCSQLSELPDVEGNVEADYPEWLFAFKYDDSRALCYIEPGRCRFISRRR